MRTVVPLLILILSGASLLNLYQVVGAQSRQGDPYAIDTQLERMRPAAAALPPRIRAGYVSDMDPSTTRGLLAFTAARYALAPHLLTLGLAADENGWVLGNFSQPTDYKSFGAQRGLEFAQDFGNGVVLYRRPRK